MVGNTKTVQDELEVLKKDVTKLRSDVAELVNILKGLGIDKINEARDSVEEEVREQRENLRMKYKNAKQRGKLAADELEEHFAEHPFGTLLTVFGIGYIIAKLSGGNS